MNKCRDCCKKIGALNKSGWCTVCCRKHIKSTGYRHTDKAKKRISESHKGIVNNMWKGDKVGISALHDWIRRRLPKPLICPKCNERPALDLANKGTYDRNLDNWEWLCRKCHMTSDNRIKTFRKTHFGLKNGSAKLTYEAVLDIRKNYNKRKVPLNTFAKKYGVSEQSVYRVVIGETWS